MSAEKVINALLTGASGVTSIVGTNVWPVFLPLGKTPPAVVYQTVSAVRLPVIDAYASAHPTRARVQLDLMAATYAEVKQLREAVKSACQFQRGSIAGVTVISVLHGGEGVDAYVEALRLFHQTVDFIVTFNE